MGLLKNAHTEELIITICKEITQIATKEIHREEIFRLNFISLLVFYFRSSNEILACESGNALINIIANSDKAKELFIKTGAIDFIVSNLLQFNCSDNLLKISLTLIRNSIYSPLHQNQFTKSDGIRKLISLLENYKMQSEPVNNLILSTIWRTVNDDNRSAFVNKGPIIELIAEIAISKKSSMLLLEKSLGTLIALCCNNEINSLALAASPSNIISLLSEIITTSRNQNLIRFSLLLLVCLSTYEPNKPLILQQQIIPAIVCLEKFGGPLSVPAATIYHNLVPN